MLKLLLLIIILASSAGLGYWYGYGNGQLDARNTDQSHSIEAKTLRYVDRMKAIEVRYKDRDGNIVIPRVKWDEMSKDGHQ